MEISFHIPNSNTQFVGDENRPPAQVSLLIITKSHVDAYYFSCQYLNLFFSLNFLIRCFVTKSCLWRMLVLEVKTLLLHLRVLLSLHQGNFLKCLEKFI